MEKPSRQTIDTAPRNGVFVILEDAVDGRFAVARWSAGTSQWLDDDDKPVQLDPTHWHPPHNLGSENKPRRPDALDRPSPGPAVGATAQPQPIAGSGRLAVERGKVRRRPGVAAMAACLLVGVAAGSLLYHIGDRAGLLNLAAADSDTEVHRSLAQEQERASRLANELAVARQEIEARAALIRQLKEDADRRMETNDRDIAGLRQALQLELSRTESLTGQLTQAQREGATHSVRARETIDDVVKERDRTIGELRQAMSAQEVQTAEMRRRINNELVQARQDSLRIAEALQQERDKVQELRLALATSRREADAQAMAARAADDEARRSANASKKSVDEQRQILRDTQAERAKLAIELAAARKEAQTHALQVESARALAAGLKESAERSAGVQTRLLQQEQDKTAKLTTELAETKSQLQALTKARASDESARDGRLAAIQGNLQEARADAAAAHESLKAERARAEQAEKLLIASNTAAQNQDSRSQAPAAPVVARYATASLSMAGPQTEKPAAEALQAPQSTTRSQASAEQPGPQAVRLIARAHLLLDQGNIGAARNMLDRAAEMGSAEALFWLAETFDPLLLPARNALGTQSDIGKARDLYKRALAAGIGEAGLRLKSLEQ